MRIRRPRARVDCLPTGFNAQRPCPHVSCKWHVWPELSHGGSAARRRVLPTDVAPSDLQYSCFLDLAERGALPGYGSGSGMTLEQAGAVLDLTRERVRQIEAEALAKLRSNGLAIGAKELMDARDAGQLDGAAPRGWSYPCPLPVLNRAERRRVDRAYWQVTHGAGIKHCKRLGCTRLAARRGVVGYCSISCARKDGGVKRLSAKGSGRVA